MQGNVEWGATDQRRQPGHFHALCGIESRVQAVQLLDLEGMTDFEGVPRLSKSTPRSRKLKAERFECLVALLVTQISRPHPLDRERCFSPPHSPAFTAGSFDDDADAGAGDVRERLGTKFQWDTRFHWQKVETDLHDCHVHCSGTFIAEAQSF